MKPHEVSASRDTVQFVRALSDRASVPPAELVRARLNHIHINVADFDRAQKFYEDHLGFKLAFEARDEDRPCRFLRNSKGDLLALDSHLDRKGMPDWFHIGFELESRAGVEHAVSYFREVGVTILDDPLMFDRYVSVTVVDPDGYHIQIYWDPD
jgi:catechol 2,3-dioxygenase-like lactoylglutathione lyase family enzyme